MLTLNWGSDLNDWQFLVLCKLHFIFHYFILGDTASREPDRESASNTGVAGASITGSVASSSYVAMKAIGGRHNRLEVSTN